MFGDNPIRSVEADPNILRVQSHFYTLQGEGPQSGRPSLFVRLAGCNLACWFCDTEFESGMDNEYRTVTFVEELCQRYSPKQRELIVLTGGEPLRQAGARLLIGFLLASGTKLVQIETAGTLWISGLETFIAQGLVQIVCSPKTPRINMNIAVYCSHWKYIIRAGDTAPDDGLPARGTGMATRDKLHMLYRPASIRDPDAILGTLHKKEDTVWLSPMDEYDVEKNKRNLHAARDLCLKFGYRLSLQVHKIAEVE